MCIPEKKSKIVDRISSLFAIIEERVSPSKKQSSDIISELSNNYKSNNIVS